MKITAFNGSARASKGNTHILVEAFLGGAAAAGAEVENVLLAEKKIKHCRGCFKCWTRTPGKCAMPDDMAELLPRFAHSDIVVFATPLYVDNVSGLMKNFMDRMVPLIDPHFAKDSAGEYRHVKAVGVPKIVVISNCGFPEQSHFQVLKLLFRRIARNMHSEVIAEIYRGEGELLRVESAMLRFMLRGYMKAVRAAGREVVENGAISEPTRAVLEKPLIAHDVYIRNANKHWDRELKKTAKKTA
ncbi:MAG: flavodoxin family protein [Elusimicrobiota bacterium]